MENKYVYVPLDTWQNMLGLNRNRISFVDIRIDENTSREKAKEYLQSALPPHLTVKDRLELNRAVLKMLNIENIFSYLTGFLFLTIAVFNVVGSIIILILKKKKDRFVMRALGLGLPQIRIIFFYYGNYLILGAGVAGILLGIIIVWIQQKTGWVKVPGTYLAYPVEIKWLNLGIVAVTVVFLSITASALAAKAVKNDMK